MNVAAHCATGNTSPRNFPSAEKQSREEVLAECAPRIERLLSRLNIPSQARADARQEAAIAVLEAIDSFDGSRGAAFWTWAFYRVYTAVRRWLGHGLYWCPPSHGGAKAKGEGSKDELESASRRGTHASVTSILEDAHGSLSRVPSSLVDSATPESLLSDLQLTEQIRVFLAGLSPVDRALLLSSSAKSERRAELLETAREFFGEGDDHGAH